MIIVQSHIICEVIQTTFVTELATLFPCTTSLIYNIKWRLAQHSNSFRGKACGAHSVFLAFYSVIFLCFIPNQVLILELCVCYALYQDEPKIESLRHMQLSSGGQGQSFRRRQTQLVDFPQNFIQVSKNSQTRRFPSTWLFTLNVQFFSLFCFLKDLTENVYFSLKCLHYALLLRCINKRAIFFRRVSKLLVLYFSVLHKKVSRIKVATEAHLKVYL